MKQIIDGKRYNTETATEIGCDSFGYPGDGNHWEEALYHTKSGQFFLAGTGGGNTQYAHQVDSNSRSGGSRITVLSPPEAFAWAESHLTTEEVEGAFEDVIEDA